MLIDDLPCIPQIVFIYLQNRMTKYNIRALCATSGAKRLLMYHVSLLCNLPHQKNGAKIYMLKYNTTSAPIISPSGLITGSVATASHCALALWSTSSPGSSAAAFSSPRLLLSFLKVKREAIVCVSMFLTLDSFIFAHGISSPPIQGLYLQATPHDEVTALMRAKNTLPTPDAIRISLLPIAEELLMDRPVLERAVVCMVRVI